eukprot:TRINITY_DN1198_c0_g3_i3.p1 TRINITY_DN1198_c0_g3~~TRINITY_DN1198_c0_g3_i3.p1  ORF type:complete len:707 (+),score=94.35 TRINITY_DN1198_c0_g3_i3:433-2553(+)
MADAEGYQEFTPPPPAVGHQEIPLTPQGQVRPAGRPGTTPLSAASAPVDPGMIPEDTGAMRETDDCFVVEFTNPGESMDFPFAQWGGRAAALVAARDYQEQRAKDKADGFVTPTPLPPAQGHPFNRRVNDVIGYVRKPFDYLVSHLPISQESVDKAKEKVEHAREQVQGVLETHTTLLDPIEPSIAPPATPPHYRPTDRNSYSTGEMFNWKFGHYHQKIMSTTFTSSIRALLYDDWHILVGTWDGTVYIMPWDPPDDGILESEHTISDFAVPLHGHGGAVVAVALTVDYICSASVDSTVRVWDRQSLHTLHALSGHKGAVTGLHLAHASKYLFSAGIDGVIVAWNLQTGMPERSMPLYKEAVTCMAGGKDFITCGYADGTVTLCAQAQGPHATPADLELCSRVDAHKEAVTAIAVSGVRVCTGARDRVRLWEIVDLRISPEAPRALRLVRAGTFGCGTTGESVSAVALDSNSLIVSYSRAIQVWDVNTGSMLYSRPSPAGAMLAIQFDSTKMMAGGYPHTCIMWDFSAGYIPPDDGNRGRHTSAPTPGQGNGEDGGRGRAASHPVEAVALTMQQASLSLGTPPRPQPNTTTTNNNNNSNSTPTAAATTPGSQGPPIPSAPPLPSSARPPAVSSPSRVQGGQGPQGGVAGRPPKPQTRLPNPVPVHATPSPPPAKPTAAAAAAGGGVDVSEAGQGGRSDSPSPPPLI